MTGYFILYKGIVIVSYQNNKLDSINFRIIELDSPYEIMRSKYPYANYIKMDLEEQLKSKNLKRTMPKKIRQGIINMPIIKQMIRDDKISEILSEIN